MAMNSLHTRYPSCRGQGAVLAVEIFHRFESLLVRDLCLQPLPGLSRCITGLQANICINKYKYIYIYMYISQFNIDMYVHIYVNLCVYITAGVYIYIYTI